MITVLTLCSSNYLAQAKALGDSLREHNSDFHFVIGLVDRFPREINHSFWDPYEVIPVETIGIPEFWEMVQRYDKVELNTAVKPFYIEHLYQRDDSVQTVIYLDPDILVYASFGPLIEKLQTYNIILTPHSCTFDDSSINIYYEGGMLNHGVYNLGFIATSRTPTTFEFLKWWKRRLVHHCYFQKGNAFDQLWVVLAPLYFPGVYVEKDPGYNMCYWNHFERRLSRKNGSYLVNGKHPLMFYHFSSYNPMRPDVITTRFYSKTASFSERPDLKPVYDDYRSRLLDAGYSVVRNLPWLIPRCPPRLNAKSALKAGFASTVRALPAACRTMLQRFAQLTTNSLK